MCIRDSISAIYTEESDNQARLNNASSLSDYRHDVLEATANPVSYTHLDVYKRQA